jgi:hypothetical protein
LAQRLESSKELKSHEADAGRSQLVICTAKLAFAICGEWGDTAEGQIATSFLRSQALFRLQHEEKGSLTVQLLADPQEEAI